MPNPNSMKNAQADMTACHASEDDRAADLARKQARLEQFSQIIIGYRKTAIDHRRGCGVEEQWAEDQDYYDGKDEHNGGRGSMEKPRTSSGSLTDKSRDAQPSSNIFLKITRPYVDAASARISDMLLPTDDRNFALKPTPIAGLIDPEKMLARKIMPAPEMSGQVMQMQQPSGIMGGAMQPQAQTAAEEKEARQLAEYEEAKKRCEKAQTVIDDWQTETQFHHEVRKMIETSSRLGTGILKGPFPIKKRRKAYLVIDQETNEKGIRIQEKTLPASKSISPWDFYPDPNCGEDIQEGSYVFEKDLITARRLAALKGPGYINEAIATCITEGPIDIAAGNSRPQDNYQIKDNDQFQIWYFHGYVPVEAMEAAGCDCKGAKYEQYPCAVTMVNNRIIKINMSPLDSGEFPYDIMVWQAKEGCWYGEGISRQGRESQRGINAAVRAMMDNAGLSSGPQIIVDSSKIEPYNGIWEIKPRKLWRKKLTGDEMTDVRDAFTVITIETRQAELLNIIQFFLKQMEDSTGLPMLMQGQQGKAPDTVGGMTILNNNGNTVLRRITRMFDSVTERHQSRYYEWLLIYGPDEAKGDFTIDARGSSALMERDLQNQAIANLTGASLNPAFGLDPEKVMRENLKGLRLDPNKLELSAEKKAAMAQQAPPPDPRLQVEELRMQAKAQELELKDIQFNTKLQAEQADRDKQREFEMTLAMLDQEMEGQKLSATERQALENAKVILANSAMKLKVQKELSQNALANRQVATPPTEPAGRAPNGQAYNA